LITYHPKTKRLPTTIGTLLILAPLLFFKYKFFLLNFFKINHSFKQGSQLIPLGISFYTFQILALYLDVKRKKMEKINFLKYFNFISFFPQMSVGPILYLKEVNNQFLNIVLSKDKLSTGLMYLLFGLFKKKVIADTLLSFVENGYQNFDTASSFSTWIFTTAYSLQLYYDFSGYSNMAIGIALCLGIKLPINFDSPYKSYSVTEFWRRWHITLGRWLKDYIFIPLGGSKKILLVTYRNLMITFIIGGIWHGSSINFLIWGALHGFILCVERGLKIRLKKLLVWKFTSLLFIHITWVFFKSNTIDQSISIINNLFYNGTQSQGRALFTAEEILITLIICISTFVLPSIHKTIYTNFRFKTLLTSICFVIVILSLCNNTVNKFIYSNF